MPTVRQVLNEKGRGVHHIRPDASVRDALTMMAEHNVGALVVLDGARLVGIITERDYARKIVLKGRTSLATLVSEIMSTRLICASLDQTVEECMAIMTAKTVRHLPVVEHEKLVGIVSIGDMVKCIIADQRFTIEQLEHYFQGGR
jgi:CBS domain-containing protein